MGHSKSTKSKQVYLIIITVAILIVFAIVIFRYLPNNGTVPNAELSLRNININLTDIAGMFPNVTYLPSSIDSIQNMSGVLYDEGYRYVSVSEFSAPSNLSYYSTYPDLITSVIYVTSNTLVASNVTKDIISGSALNQTNSTGSNYAGIVLTPYSFRGIEVNISTLYNVAVLNSSDLFMVSQYPVFQQTSIINYKNEICVVTVNGYKNMSAGTSTKIAKVLFNRIISR
jgi:hypothetical protein